MRATNQSDGAAHRGTAPRSRAASVLRTICVLAVALAGLVGVGVAADPAPKDVSAPKPRPTAEIGPATSTRRAFTRAPAPDTKVAESAIAPEGEPTEAPVVEPFDLLDAQTLPGTRRTLGWHANADVAGLRLDTPVLISHGTKAGPVLCLTSAVHGDELNGIEIVRRVIHSVEPTRLSGTVVGVPVVNLVGFQRGSRYLPDRRDLNRYFPGNPNGSLASRIAHSFFESVVRHCDHLVDMHTGSFHRANLPQLRADLSRPKVLEMTKGFGAISVLHSKGGEGTLRRAATLAGIPSVTIEAGEPMRLQDSEVKEGVAAVEALMHSLGMVERFRLWSDPQPVFYESTWVRADRSGILLAEVQLGDNVSVGQRLGTVVDPVTNAREELTSPYAGRVLGMALNQMVMPGFAAFRVGIVTKEDVLADATTSDPEGEHESENSGDGPADRIEELNPDGEGLSEPELADP